MIEMINKILAIKGDGIIYLDNQLKIIHCDERANNILNRKDGLVQQLGKLVLCDKAAQKKMIQFSGFEHKINDEIIYVRRDSGDLPYKLNLIIYQGDWVDQQHKKPDMLALITEPNASFAFPQWIFSNYYQLTNAELMLVKAIFTDTELRDFADERGVQVSTIRWTLNNVFSKTQTHSQAQVKSLALQYS